MSPHDLARSEIQSYIRLHENDDERNLVLKNKTIEGIPVAKIAEQILSRRKAKEKLPLYYNTPGVVFPPPLNLEQSSSEITARFKQELISTMFGAGEIREGADLTSGYGIDSLFLSSCCVSFSAIEPNPELLGLSSYNHSLFGNGNITYYNSLAENFMTETNKVFDFIFVDPSRRKEEKKVVKLADCHPDVVSLLPSLFEKSSLLIIKTSPLLDLHQALKELQDVIKIVIVAVKNECKEVLFFCRQGHLSEPVISCINFNNYPQRDTFDFLLSEEKKSSSFYSEPLAFIYEPNAAILKGGAFKAIGQQTGLHKIHRHTHLYTSDQLLADFPGRVFEIEKKDLKSEEVNALLPSRKANVITRNYPLSADELKKKLKISDGGEKFVIGYTGLSGRYVSLGHRVAPPNGNAV